MKLKIIGLKFSVGPGYWNLCGGIAVPAELIPA